jgi:hypothetical protein
MGMNAVGNDRQTRDTELTQASHQRVQSTTEARLSGLDLSDRGYSP